MRVTCLVIALLLTSQGSAETRAVVVAGLGGEPEYDAEFRRHAEASAGEIGKVASDVTVLTGEQADRERLGEALGSLAARTGASDVVVVLLIGHGSFDDRDYRFMLRGPDITGRDLLRWLDALPAERQLVVVATSSSGALQPLLASPSRTVITATRSGGENNVTVFPRYFAQALTHAGADIDKDGHVSALEAFRFAEAAVDAHYQERRQMATEHPVLEGPEARVTLATVQAGREFDPSSALDRARLEELEAAIASLRRTRDDLEPEAYYGELQRLLLEVAVLRRRLDPGPGS